MDKTKQKHEVWQRGPIEGVPGLLQPVAHALLQASEEVQEIMKAFPDVLIWETPGGAASPAFHLQHMRGVIDRLFTYAKSEALQPYQLQQLEEEGKRDEAINIQDLIVAFDKQVTIALEQLKTTNENTLTEFRGVGRAQLPSTVMGLLFHSAEHTMRHLGQLIVTMKVLKGER